MNEYKSDSIFFPKLAPHFRTILYSFNRRRELIRLVRWARYKHLRGPMDAYRTKLELEDLRLAYYVKHFPLRTSIARGIHTITYLSYPKPTYLRKGSARSYRSGTY